MAAEQTEHSPASAPAPRPRLGGVGLLGLLAGFLAGLILYLPWDTLWDMALHRLAARQAPLQITWQNIDRASPLGFRINGLSVAAPGWPVAPRLVWLDVRLGMSPRLTLRADTGGRELRVVCLDTGDFDLRGAANLSCLGRRDILGSVDLRGEGRVVPETRSLEKGFLDLRGKALQLPAGLWLGDVALALEYKAGAVRIRSFTLREPTQVRAEGTATLAPGAPLATRYDVTGEIVSGRTALPLAAQGTLRDFLGGAVLPAQPE